MKGRHWLLGVPFILMAGALGYRSLAQSNFNMPGLPLPGRVSTIQAVQTQPEVDSTVYLRGQIGDRIPLVNSLVYELQDETGTIWVLTTDSTVPSGAEVFVRGIVRYQSIPLAGRDYGETYIEEQGRDAR